MTNKNLQKGFTLVEIIFYFAILGVVLLAMMSFSIQILDLSQKSENFHELQSSSTFISDKISNSIKLANSVDAGNSIFDDSSGALSLVMPIAGDSPTRIYLDAQNIYFKEGASEAVKLNSDGTTCSVLNFQRLTNPKTPDQIIIDAECNPLNVELDKHNQTTRIHTSVSLRKS